MDPAECGRIINTMGLVFDMVCAFVLAVGLFLRRERALELGISRLSGETPEENLALPAFRDRLRQSRTQ